jgi:chemotaxis protein methyltransferase CheR
VIRLPSREAPTRSQLLQELGADLGMQLVGYRPGQVQGRLDTFMRGHDLDIWTLRARLRDDPALARDLRHALTIHVTAFYRDPACWERLQGVIEASPPRRRWRVWSAATSTGAEAVSAVGLLVGLGREVSVLATDVDTVALEQARQGIYPDEMVGTLDPATRGRLLLPQGDGMWKVTPAVAARITYLRHDLLDAAYPAGPFDLILCRNVLIYMGTAERAATLARLAALLVSDGVLFLSATEVLLDARAYGLVPLGCSLYRKAAAGLGRDAGRSGDVDAGVRGRAPSGSTLRRPEGGRAVASRPATIARAMVDGHGPSSPSRERATDARVRWAAGPVQAASVGTAAG